MTDPQVPFTGPFTVGPPAEALVVRPPQLTKVGWHELARTAQIAAVLLVTVLRALLRHIARAPRELLGLRRDRAVRRSYADAVSVGLVDGFMTLGPTFVKLGQAIASSPGVFPRPLADACLRTLDDVPPFPVEVACRMIEEDLHAPVSEAFRSIDPEPLSAASIAQVHACVLDDGREAVLKIQRPDICDIMNRDLRIMYRMAKVVDRFEKGHLMNAPAIIEDLHQVTNEELNFAFEAHRQTQFRDNIGAFGDNKHITAPEVYWDHCGPRVICMERMYGTPLDRVVELEERGIDGELVLRRGVKVWMEAALVHGPFHGDVHAGNLWLLDDGRAAFLDFGIMGVLPELHREAVRDAEYTVMIDGDYTRVVRAWQRIGILSIDTGPIEEMAGRLKMVLDPMFDMKIHEVSLGSIMKQQLDLQQEYGARSPRELVLVTKQLVYFERYAKALAPDYNMARDLWLLKNVFPEAVAAKAEERGVAFPD
jgi:predicted unusual protein kinase regulating ubiquinone biosynthesis (AarF/ABC1/UbiB family)